MSKSIIIDGYPIIRIAVRVLLERAGHSVLTEGRTGEVDELSLLDSLSD